MLARNRHLSSLAVLALLFAAWPAHARTSTPEPQTLRIAVEGQPPLLLNRTALAAMARTSVATPAIHHVPATQWQGVSLEELLRRAGVRTGEQLRGAAMTTVVHVIAADHYQVVFSLGELDPLLGHEQVVLADTEDGHALKGDGPFRLVVPGDQRPARWVRNVMAIEVTRHRSPTP